MWIGSKAHDIYARYFVSNLNIEKSDKNKIQLDQSNLINFKGKIMFDFQNIYNLKHIVCYIYFS